MKPQHLLLSLGWLMLITGCTPTPETVATAPATRPASVATTPAPVISPIPDTPLLLPSSTSTPTFTPLPTLSLAELGATYTAQAAAYTPPPTQRPTSTFTPTPTFTPIPGPVWPILFAGGRCRTGDAYTNCGQDMVDEWGWYQIHSDGSGLRSVPQLNLEPEFRIQAIRFSPDGNKMAYWAWSEQGYRLFLAGLDNSNPLEMITTPFERSALLGGFDFMPETDCLVLYWRFDINQSPEVEKVSIERVCPDRMEPQVLDVIEFPDLWPRFAHHYLLSPQGDALLAVGPDRNYNEYLYIQELETIVSPRLLFTAPDQQGLSLGPVWWQPDGQQIEFIQNVIQPDDTVSLTHYVVSRDGQNVQSRLELTAEFVLVTGGWSQDGREIAFFSSLFDFKPETTGIYVFDLENGTWRQILAGYYLFEWPTWIPELP